MANDSIWIRCTLCNDCLCIGKYFPGDIYPVNKGKFDIWVVKHFNERIERDYKAFDADLQGDTGFEFLTEEGYWRYNQGDTVAK